MSRAGRRARQMRLLAAGEWRPASGRPPLTRSRRPPASDRAERERIRALRLDQELWIAVAGIVGWNAEVTRRRADYTARLRQRRLSGYAAQGKAA